MEDSKPRLSVSSIMPKHEQPFTTPAGDNPSPAFFIPITIYKNCIPLSINGKIPLYLHKIKGEHKS
ncbi:hypothetical protein D3C81_1931920 [compost metagenome]